MCVRMCAYLFKWNSLSVINISGIVTNGILLMVARGTCKINMRWCNYAPNLHLIRYHCRGHQENVCLCTSALKMDSIHTNHNQHREFCGGQGLNHHQFQEFLRSVDAEYCYTDIIYFLKVKWSWDQMFKRFYEVWHVVKSFMVSKPKCIPQLVNENKLTYLATLVDLSTPLKWPKTSLRWKAIYQYNASNNNSLPNKKTRLWHARTQTIVRLSICV